VPGGHLNQLVVRRSLGTIARDLRRGVPGLRGPAGRLTAPGGGQPMLRYQVCAPGTLAVSPLPNYYRPAIGNPRPQSTAGRFAA